MFESKNGLFTHKLIIYQSISIGKMEVVSLGTSGFTTEGSVSVSMVLRGTGDVTAELNAGRAHSGDSLLGHGLDDLQEIKFLFPTFGGGLVLVLE